jgi:predicted nuclease with TOPRIM domain
MSTVSALKKIPIESFINSLRYIAPPEVVIHIGAGTGQGLMHCWRKWNVSSALILDATDGFLIWAQDVVAAHPYWKACSAVLAQNCIATDYHIASNPNENGLISPAQLAELWPNLHSVATMPVQTQTLDDLIAIVEFASELEKSNLWTIIDCLSGLDILKGATHTIGKASVLWLRVLLQPLASTSMGTLQDIDQYLQVLGYRLVTVEESNHPSIGEALFVRDWSVFFAQNAKTSECAKLEIDTLKRTQDEQNTLINEQQQRLETITQERDQSRAFCHEQQLHIDTVNHERAQWSEHQQKLETELASLRQVHDGQNALIHEQQQRLEAITQERDQVQSQIEVLNQANAIANADKAALENLIEQQSEQRRVLQYEMLALAQARDEQTQRADDCQNHRETLQIERDTYVAQNTEKQAQLEGLSQEKSELLEKLRQLTDNNAAITQARDEQTQRADDCQNHRETLQIERDIHVAQNTEKQAQLEGLSQEKAELLEKLRQLTDNNAAITQARDEQTQRAHDCQNHCETLQIELGTLVAENTEIQAQLERLTQGNASLIEKQNVLNSEVKQMETQLQKKAACIAQLETEATESHARHQMLNEEIIKAEAQIELIKDVLLREQSL